MKIHYEKASRNGVAGFDVSIRFVEADNQIISTRLGFLHRGDWPLEPGFHLTFVWIFDWSTDFPTFKQQGFDRETFHSATLRGLKAELSARIYVALIGIRESHS